MPDDREITPPQDAPTRRDPPPSGKSAKSIGPYHLRQKLGEGGMGEVWLAEQSEPVRRPVAIKIIKRGMDTKQVVARFEAERQALAIMDHPNIAKVYDAGETPDGRPYFVMEYVKGDPITEYCDRQRLTTRQRLELFMDMCAGVQHAHHKAVIHRDIKPSNVLVTVVDGKLVLKLIDFGVSKAIAHRLTEKTLFTEIGAMVGTPEYMSPEQAEMGATDVDTRTDVYSLGVTLYQLLTGALPFDSEELRSAAYDEIRRIIREDQPSKPSTRVATLGAASTEAARKRQTETRSLARELRGDLDWITMRALEKDRTRRYESPAAFADDVRRHLANQPVEARPPSTAYRANRFVRRHRVGVAVAAAAALLLVAFGARERVQATRIVHERDRANREAEAARQSLEFMTGIFEISDPGEARGKSITAREVLDRGAQRIDETLAGQPEVRARMLTTIGDVYASLGLYSEAERLLEQAVAARKETLGSDHRDTLDSMTSLAIVLQNQALYSRAEPLYVEALALQRQVLGDEDPDTLDTMNLLAGLYWNQARYDEAESLYSAALDTRRRLQGDDHRGTLGVANNLALLYWSQKRYDEAEPLYRRTFETMSRVLGEDHPDTLRTMSNLGLLYASQGRYDEAEPLHRRDLEINTRVLGEDHPETLVSMSNLANLCVRQGRDDEAESLYLEALNDQRRVRGEDHPDTLLTMGNLGKMYAGQGRYDEAEPLYDEALAAQQRVLGEDHPETLRTMGNLGRMYAGQGRYDEAVPLYNQVLATQRRVLGEDHPETVNTLYDTACLEALRGNRDQALDLLRQAVEVGYANADWMAKDTDLEALHGPQFEALVARARGQNAIPDGP